MARDQFTIHHRLKVESANREVSDTSLLRLQQSLDGRRRQARAVVGSQAPAAS